MKTIVEFFKWDFEGEYQQYFFVTEDEEQLVKDVLEYLNTVHINTKYPWSDCLSEFKVEDQIDNCFIDFQLTHLKEYYYIQDDDVKFTLTKHTKTYKTEDIK